MLNGRKIVLGVSGGIAAFKSCELVSQLKKRGAQVRVVLTRHACEFVPPLSFETLSGNPAYTDGQDRRYEIGHVALAKWADAMVIAPATANILAKAACGIADDLLSTTLVANAAPVLFAPAVITAATVFRSVSVSNREISGIPCASSGSTRSSAPFSRHAAAQGKKAELCSSAVVTTLQPRASRFFAIIAQAMFSASVAFRVNAVCSGLAPIHSAAHARAAS